MQLVADTTQAEASTISQMLPHIQIGPKNGGYYAKCSSSNIKSLNKENMKTLKREKGNINIHDVLQNQKLISIAIKDIVCLLSKR